MALGGALVDRARIVRKAPGVPVEGRQRFAPVYGAWFRCRFELRNQRKGREPQSNVPRVVKQPHLMYGLRDMEGQNVELLATDLLQVVSPELGQAFYELTGDPDPMRKRRRVLGWEVDLQRVEEHEFDFTGAGAGAA